MGPVVPVKLRPDQYSPLIKDLRKRKNAKVTRVKNVTKYKKVTKPRKLPLVTSSPPIGIFVDETLIEENDSNNNHPKISEGALDRKISRGQVETEVITCARRINSDKEAGVPLCAQENGTLVDKREGDEIDNHKDCSLGLVLSESDGEVEYSSNHIDDVPNARKIKPILKSSKRKEKLKFGDSRFEHKHGTGKLYRHLILKPNKFRYRYSPLSSYKRIVAGGMRHKGVKRLDKGDLSVRCNINDETGKNDEMFVRTESNKEYSFEGSVTVNGDKNPSVNYNLMMMMDQSHENLHWNVENSKLKMLNECNHGNESKSRVESSVMMDKHNHMLDKDREESDKVLQVENLDSNQKEKKNEVLDSNLKISDNNHPEEDTTLIPCIVEWIWTALQARILQLHTSTDNGNCEVLEAKNEPFEDALDSNEHVSEEGVAGDNSELIPTADFHNKRPLCVAEWLLTARQISSEQRFECKDNDNDYKHDAITGLMLSSLLTPSELQLQGFLANTVVSDLETHLLEFKNMDTSDPDVIITEVQSVQGSGNGVEIPKNTKINIGAEKELLKVDTDTLVPFEKATQPPKIKEEVDDRIACIDKGLEILNATSDSDSDVVLLSDDETDLYSSTITQSSVYPWQEAVLSQTWEEWPLPDKDIVQLLCQDTGLSVNTIMDWFEKRTEEEITKLWREI